MKTIALSLSNSPESDLRARGLVKEHLNHAWLEMARHLFDAGHAVAYGGDLRPDGFTGHLIQLAARHCSVRVDPCDVVSSYLTWPDYLQIESEHHKWLLSVATLVAVPPPADLVPNPSTLPSPTDPLAPYIKARTLTKMRRKMTDETDARLMSGGQLATYKGIWPGLVEEAYWTLKAGKPLYLMGGFGGATATVIEALKGGTPEALTPERLRAHTVANAGERGPLDDIYRRRGDTELIDEDPLAFFHAAGIQSLRNGLSPEENEQLFELVDPLEAVVLVLRGLAALDQRAS